MSNNVPSGIVRARPPGLQVLTADPPAFLRVRDGVAEVTIWRVEAVLIARTHEQDGDYHLVLQGNSGASIVYDPRLGRVLAVSGDKDLPPAEP